MSPSFEDNVQALPAELFNRIQDLVLAVPPRWDFSGDFSGDFSADFIEVTSPTYSPPKLLQINRSLRQAFADVYYSETTFFFRDNAQLDSWLSLLSKEHRQKVTSISLYGNDLTRVEGMTLRDAIAFNNSVLDIWRVSKSVLKAHGVRLTHQEFRVLRNEDEVEQAKSGRSEVGMRIASDDEMSDEDEEQDSEGAESDWSDEDEDGADSDQRDGDNDASDEDAGAEEENRESTSNGHGEPHGYGDDDEMHDDNSSDQYGAEEGEEGHETPCGWMEATNAERSAYHSYLDDTRYASPMGKHKYCMLMLPTATRSTRAFSNGWVRGCETSKRWEGSISL